MDDAVLVHRGAVVGMQEILPYGSADRDTLFVSVANAAAGAYSLCSSKGTCDSKVLPAGGEVRFRLGIRN